MRFSLFIVGFTALAFTAFVAEGCSSPSSNGFAGGDAADDGPSLFSDGSDASGPCHGIACNVDVCDSSDGTTLQGKVYDPSGRNPLYNVIVYVPNDPLNELPKGVSCDKCGTLVSGAPITSALTDADGSFVLKHVPSGANIPLVMQIGKWRRQITLPSVTACEQNFMDDSDLLRLPRNQHEGDIPLFAIATGGADAFECLLLKIGIEQSEFTGGAGSGRVHLYEGGSGTKTQGSGTATDLWANANDLKKYDVLINACEGGEEAQSKPQGAIDNVVSYANAGGRVFATHFQYYFIDPSKIKPEDLPQGTPSVTSPWSMTATFVTEPNSFFPTSITAAIDTSFPKGDAFAHWLEGVGVSGARTGFKIEDPRKNAASVNAPSLRWISGDWSGGSDPALLHYTFNTPIDAAQDNQCGKVLYSDFHVSEGKHGPLAALPFPDECPGGLMTAQEKALEFMLFDLSSCIQDDRKPPVLH